MFRCLVHSNVWYLWRHTSLNIFQDSMLSARLNRVWGSLSETFVGRCRCIKNFFTAWSVLSEQIYVPSRIYSTCGPSTNATVYQYNRGTSSNGQAPLFWWYFFKFSSIITLSSVILSVISSIMPLVCCWVTRLVPGFPNFPLVYYICLDRVRSSSLICIFLICVAAELLPDSSSVSERLVRYSMLGTSA